MKPNLSFRPKMTLIASKPSQRNSLKNRVLQPTPPSQPKFIRKSDPSRSHTPDQPALLQKPPVNIPQPKFRRSITPLVHTSHNEKLSTEYFKPNENRSYISNHIIDKDDSLTIPFEVETGKPTHKAYSTIPKKPIKSFVDLKKGSFSNKQTINSKNIPFKYSKSSMLSDSFLKKNLEESTLPSRSPSPTLLPRNIKCLALSKNFKINRKDFLIEAQKNSFDKVKENKNDEIFEAPWQSILNDLDNVIKIKNDSNNLLPFDISKLSMRLVKG